MRPRAATALDPLPQGAKTFAFRMRSLDESGDPAHG
jgi:hypothetical protein